LKVDDPQDASLGARPNGQDDPYIRKPAAEPVELGPPAFRAQVLEGLSTGASGKNPPLKT
jgi:hypothetical protein